VKGKSRVKAREPANQYQFEEKQEYRETVWKILAENVKAASTASVLFFPGRHGSEIKIALRYGFQEENLIACEENAALLATAKWRKSYPNIKCYGNKLSRTIERLAVDKVKLDAVNLDYCSNLCTAVIDDLRKLLNYGVTQPNMILAITLLKGRENRTTMDIARLVFKEATGAVDRIGLIQSLLTSWNYWTQCLLKSEYRSNTKNMVFGLFVVVTAEWVKHQFQKFYESCVNEVDALLQLDDEVLMPQSFESYQALQKQFADRQYALKIKYQEFKDTFCLMKHSSYFNPYTRSDAQWRWHQLFSIGKRRHREDYSYFQQELSQTRQLLIKSESEKAQILQAGYAYK